MSLAACSSLCGRDSERKGVFAKRARSSAQFASVIISAGHHLLLVFFNVKLFSFIDVCSA